MKTYDLALLGGGAAGLSLALALVNSPLRHQSILVVEKDTKNHNDRTWSFWIAKLSPFDKISYKTWDYLRIAGEGYESRLLIHPYRYQVIRGLDFYRFAREELARYPNVELLHGTVEHMVDGQDSAVVTVGGRPYRAAWVFDSRFQPQDLRTNPARHHYLMQHFRGWEIQAPTDTFDPRAATLFDFRGPHNGGLDFFYVLPFTKRRALVEYTLFSPALLEEQAYERALRGYIEGFLGIGSYQVVSREAGAIPMTNHPFQRRLGERILATGTRGGLVKPSTGYAFARIQRDSQTIVRSLLQFGHPFALPRPSCRHRFYDSLFLDVLSRQSRQAIPVLLALFTRNSPDRVLRFLDEESNPFEELKIIASLPPSPFLRALRRFVQGPWGTWGLGGK